MFGAPSHLHFRAQIFLLLSAVFFATMAFLTKIATRQYPGGEIAMIRFGVALLPLLFFPSILRRSFQVHRLSLLFYRGFFGGLAVLLYFTAIEHIPVGVAALLNYTAPVFSGTFAALFLNERLRGRVVIPLLLTFSGVFLVVAAHQTPDQILGFGVWELAGLGSGICAGAAVTAMRGARRTENSWSVLTSLSLFGLLATAPVGILTWKQPDARGWLLLLTIGGLALAGQLMMTWAYRFVETLTAGVISQFTVVVAIVLGVLFLGEELSRGNLLGTFLTISGVIAVMVLTRGRGGAPSAGSAESGQ